jgi:hypothetical protein
MLVVYLNRDPLKTLQRINIPCIYKFWELAKFHHLTRFNFAYLTLLKIVRSLCRDLLKCCDCKNLNKINENEAGTPRTVRIALCAQDANISWCFKPFAHPE